MFEHFARTDRPFPEIRGTCEGVAFVVASGRTVFDDLLKAGFDFGEWDQEAAVIAVNDIGMHLPCRIDHWYSNDLALRDWFAARRPPYKKRDGKIVTHSCYHKGVFDHHWPWPGNGTSTAGAVLTGLALGYQKIFVCGAPMDEGGHYFDPPWVGTNFKSSGDLRFWRRCFSEVFDGRVEFMSGVLSGL